MLTYIFHFNFLIKKLKDEKSIPNYWVRERERYEGRKRLEQEMKRAFFHEKLVINIMLPNDFLL